jgi:hypothetical protein
LKGSRPFIGPSFRGSRSFIAHYPPTSAI